MVVFACNSCGATLKKNQVDKHVYQCRCNSVSCMDCQKDFGIKEYSAHLKCVSEAEKYGGTDWKAPTNFNKGEKKQQAWVDTVNNTLKQAGKTLSPPCRNLMQTLAKHDNVPRKKAKFINFLTNIARGRFDNITIENVWNLLEQQWKSQAEAKKEPAVVKPESEKENGGSKNTNGESLNNNTTNGTSVAEDAKKLSKREKKEARKQKQHKEEKKEKRNKSENGETKDVHSQENGVTVDSDEKVSKKESKKRKRLDSEAEHETKKPKTDLAVAEDEDNGNQKQIGTVEEETTNDFRWGAVIREVLLKQPDHEISIKKLRKKVLAEYYSVVGDSKGTKTQEELVSKLNKKLKKQQFKVHKDLVALVGWTRVK